MEQFSKWWKKHGIKFWMAVSFFGIYVAYSATNTTKETMKILRENTKTLSRSVDLCKELNKQLTECQNEEGMSTN